MSLLNCKNINRNFNINMNIYAPCINAINAKPKGTGWADVGHSIYGSNQITPPAASPNFGQIISFLSTSRQISIDCFHVKSSKF